MQCLHAVLFCTLYTLLDNFWFDLLQARWDAQQAVDLLVAQLKVQTSSPHCLASPQLGHVESLLACVL